MRVPLVGPDGQKYSVEEAELGPAMEQGYKMAPASSHMPGTVMGASHGNEPAPQALTATMGFNRGLFPFAKQLTMGAGVTGGGMGALQTGGRVGDTGEAMGNRTTADRDPSYGELSKTFDETQAKAFADNPKTRIASEVGGAVAGAASGNALASMQRADKLAKLERGLEIWENPAVALSLKQAAKDAAPLAGNIAGSALPVPFATHVGGAIGAKMAGKSLASQGNLFSPYKNLKMFLGSPAVSNQVSRLGPPMGTVAGAGVTPFADLIDAYRASQQKP